MPKMESSSLKFLPSSISKIWRIDTNENGRLSIPKKKLRWPVTSIIGKIINPILSADIIDFERVYYQKIEHFQKLWIELPQINDTDQGNKRYYTNLSFYNRTLKMIKRDQLFDKDVLSITGTTEILKDYEITVGSILSDSNRLALFEREIKADEFDVKDFLYSLYGSYLALVCFWIIARNVRENGKIIHNIAKVSHKLAISLDSYNDTLDIMTNPDEMDKMRHAENWERKRLKREQELHNR